MLEEGIAKPAMSEWARLVVLVSMQDGRLYLYIDYRKLVTMTVRDTYPLLRINERADPLRDATIFLTNDCKSGYWQTEIPEAD